MKKQDLTKYLSLIALIFIMFCAYTVNSRRSKMNEVARLPFYNIQLQNVKDGIYEGKTYTTFAHVQLKVKIQNHKIVDIETIECEGQEVGKAAGVLQEMVEKNTIVVQAKKGREIGTMIFISCVDNALYGKDEILTETDSQ